MAGAPGSTGAAGMAGAAGAAGVPGKVGAGGSSVTGTGWPSTLTRGTGTGRSIRCSCNAASIA